MIEIKGPSRDLVLTPISRRPLRLPDETVRVVLSTPVPEGGGIRSAEPTVKSSSSTVSVIVVTFNNLVFTRLCLESLMVNTDYPNYEVIVVDNGSDEDTVSYLKEMARRYEHFRVIFNRYNLGFAPANNQGLSEAKGEVLILLNNDTIVPPGCLAGLVKRLDDPEVGLVGPVTNRAGNEAQVETSYRTYGEMICFAENYMREQEGVFFDIRTLTMFCLAMRRDVFELIGPLDERFEIGMFEDDDYSMRARAAGYKVVCDEGVFIHHFGEASFGSLAPSGKYGELFHANRRRFEEKWGGAWEPHRQRINRDYQGLTEQIREVVRRTLAEDATIAIISKGDESLLDLCGRRAWHFPQADGGGYAGHYPSDSADAISQLEVLRVKGANCLLIPEPSLWWLTHYGGFREHLEQHYKVLFDQKYPCLIFALNAEADAGGMRDTL